MQGTASNNAPSSFVVIPHFITGGVVWFFSLLILLLNTDILTVNFSNFKLLSITHLLVLSWITTIIFGALYQLLPVILLCKLYSEKLAILTFVLLQIGSIGMFFCFWQQITGNFLILSGSIVCGAILLFSLNIYFTLQQSEVIRIEKTFIVTSVFWLLGTVLVGLLLAVNFSYPFLTFSHIELLKVHAHFGLIGWITQLIIGVGSVLIPMFTLSHSSSKKPLKLSYIFLNAALLLGLISKLIAFETGVLLSLILGSIGLLSFFFFILTTYKSRVKKKLDIGMKKSMLAFLFILLAILASIPTFFKQNDFLKFPETIYFSILIIGFVSTLIMGQTYKTLPFIIWLKEYKAAVGKEKTPLPKDLYSDFLATWQLRFHLIGFVMLIIGLAINNLQIITFGITFLLLAACLYLINLSNITFHKRKKNDIINN
jgi:hypothetical protein